MKTNQRHRKQERNPGLTSWVIIAFLSLGWGYLFNYLALDSDLNWTRTIYEKKIKIARQFNGNKRLLLLGGSGTHYNFDALQIESELGIPAINIGLHGGLGLNAILESVTKDIRPGDIILLILEYGLLSSNDGSGWLSSSFGIAIGRPGIGGSGLEQKARDIFVGGTVSLTTFGKSIWRIVFKAEGRASKKVDARGNAVIFTKGTPYPTNVSKPVSNYAFNRLKNFQDIVERRGAKLAFTLPWILIASDDVTSFAIVKDIIKALNTIAPVLYNEETLNLQTNPALFSDSAFHLNSEGRHIASDKFAKQLKLIITYP